MIQSCKMALRSISAGKMRAALTMLGIIIGVMALVVLVSLVNGATSSVTDKVSALGSSMVTATVSDDKGVRAWLTQTETKLLKILLQAGGAGVGIDALIDELRGNGFACEDAMLYTHVCRLRRKLGREGRRIVCRRGIGYCLVCR